MTAASALATSVLVNSQIKKVPARKVSSSRHRFLNFFSNKPCRQRHQESCITFHLPSSPPPINAAPPLIALAMPTYGPLRTTVSLYMWEPDACQDVSGLGDASSGCAVERIREDAFDNTSLDFLGPGSVPFYLINAGQDLFSPAPPADNGDAVTPAKRVNSSATPGSAESVGPAIRSPLTSPLANDLLETDHDSSLSSLDSSMFETGRQAIDTGSSPGAIADSADSASNTNTKTSKHRRLFNPPVTVKNGIQKPITSPKALKLQIDLSKESFIHSIVTNTPEDICISVFYNGEFVYSRVFRWNTFNSGQKAEGGHPAVSGRRVGTTVEVPFIINPMPHDVPTGSASHSMCAAEVRWAKINQKLLREADEWGRDGKFNMFRNPLGEYLEALSKTSVPKKAWHLGDSGLNIGVIDVIVGLGKSIIHPYKFLLGPQRKLTEGRCGLDNKLFVVPKELSQISLNNMIASFQSEDDRDQTARTAKRARSTGTRSKVASSRTAMVESSSSSKTSAANAPESGSAGGHDGLTESGQYFRSLAFTVPPPGSPLRNPQEDASEISGHPKVPQIPAVQIPPPKSKLPKKVPQKRYRGPTSPPVEAAPMTPDMYIEPPSHFTRSRTSVGSADSPLGSGIPATTAFRSQGPVDGIQKPHAQRQLVKSQRLTGPTTPVPRNNSFGLDGFEDCFCAPWSLASRSLSGLNSPLRQLPSTETNQVHRNVGFSFDGTGDEPKSTKRKRTSLEASPAGAPNAKVSRRKPKSRNVSSASVQSQPVPTESASSDVSPQVVIRSGSQAPTDGKQTTAAKKPRQRNPLSARELDSLLEPHKPTANADTSFGLSLAKRGNSSRSTRNSITRPHIQPQSKSSSPPRITARVIDGNILVIKGLRVDEMPKDEEKVHLAEKPTMILPKLPDTSMVLQGADEVQAAIVESVPTSSSTYRVLRSTKQKDSSDSIIEVSSVVQGDNLESQNSTHIPPVQGVEAEKGICKDAFVTDLKKLTQVLDSVPVQAYDISDFMDSSLSSASKPSPNVATALANKKENARPSLTTSLGPTSTQPERIGFHVPINALEVTKSSTNSELEATATFSAEDLNRQFGTAGPSSTENTEKAVVVAAPITQQHLPDMVAGQIGQPANNIEDAAAASEAKVTNDAPSAWRNQTASAKQPPVMKLKTKTSTDIPTEPQTPINKQSKVKPGLTIQPGLANAYRSYSETSTGLKTPTPRSGTFPTTQAPEPPRTRAATRALQEAFDISAIAMRPMISFTPQKNREQNKTPSGRLVFDMSSSPTAPTPAPITRETRILPSKRFQQASPSKSRVFGSDNQASTPTAIDAIVTADDLAAPNDLKTKSAAQRPEPHSVAESSPGRKITTKPQLSRQRRLRDDTSRPWKPTELCQDSVLSYVDESNSAGFAGLKYDQISENICRSTKSEREGVFRTSGILMGVRYVMGLGSE